MELVLPSRFRERVDCIVDDQKKFYRSLEKPLPRAFRINTLKADKKKVVKSLREYGLKITSVPWDDLAFVVEDGVTVGSTMEHFMGHIYIQELVSMLPPLLLKNEIKKTENPVILDACAAPGSKTTQISALMGNSGLLVANDSSFGRMKILKHNIEKLGCSNVVALNRDARHLKTEFKFDFIFLDAPCSSEGIIRKNPNIMTHWSTNKIKWLSKMQQEMIVNCYDLLKKGGTMIYSTCTYSPEENERVIHNLLTKRNAKIKTIKIKGLETSPTVKEWNGKKFDRNVKKAVRIWPHHNDTGGFFMAKIQEGSE
ncbi:MAG: RsmB/NOP family class I SAM-dependent RNA methyltransferase [Candidatus Peribacteraceae bacterium]|nr:RsmB/NOP family class I SAM-dependent RNA methyltransferase [Candidatus Peribacteraceae bacterium]